MTIASPQLLRGERPAPRTPTTRLVPKKCKIWLAIAAVRERNLGDSLAIGDSHGETQCASGNIVWPPREAAKKERGDARATPLLSNPDNRGTKLRSVVRRNGSAVSRPIILEVHKAKILRRPVGDPIACIV
jgi:hypothetical protein